MTKLDYMENVTQLVKKAPGLGNQVEAIIKKIDEKDITYIPFTLILELCNRSRRVREDLEDLFSELIATSYTAALEGDTSNDISKKVRQEYINIVGKERFQKERFITNVVDRVTHDELPMDSIEWGALLPAINDMLDKLDEDHRKVVELAFGLKEYESEDEVEELINKYPINVYDRIIQEALYMMRVNAPDDILGLHIFL